MVLVVMLGFLGVVNGVVQVVKVVGNEVGKSSYFVRFQLCSTGFNFGEYDGSHSNVNQSDDILRRRPPPLDAHYSDPRSVITRRP